MSAKLSNNPASRVNEVLEEINMNLSDISTNTNFLNKSLTTSNKF